ncbi:hypothetical protein FHS83_000182 [Rhizomicrobium palustre]|jgi:hypothetical protein|uniref:Uncharacterized protein n=1 Tax=Rhizomicrobium palustre TaxID=189966 RepID=A0A846MTV2_9PROT|nr:hypothetical protein [Rhizomicrobium palustre]NIK86864.1 hypothetical protein [Rhizomicrobium palustre]
MNTKPEIAGVSLAQLVAAWSAEAVAAFGQDWPKITAHISARFEALPMELRLRLQAEAAHTIAADRLGAAALRH